MTLQDPQRALVVAEARRWLGTPFRHQGRLLGVGCDCIGLTIEVARALGLSDYQNTSYGRRPDPRRMRALLDEHMDRVAIGEALDGDWWFMSWNKRPHHMAMKTPVGVIHACEDYGAVVEHAMSPDWVARVRSCYRYRGLR